MALRTSLLPPKYVLVVCVCACVRACVFVCMCVCFFLCMCELLLVHIMIWGPIGGVLFQWV